MNERPKERRDRTDGRAFLTMSATMPPRSIAAVANITEAEVRRLIELAKQSKK